MTVFRYCVIGNYLLPLQSELKLLKRTNMKKFFLLALCAFVSTFAKAYDFQMDGFYYDVIDKSGPYVAVVRGDVKYKGNLTIPNTVTYDGKTYTVTEMGANAFQECLELTSIVINDHIKLIPYWAFGNCTNLEKVTLGKSVERFGMRAFLNCTSLSSINLNDNIVAFGDCDTFRGCTSLTKVVIGSNVRRMDGSEFAGCTNLETVEIHEGATVIGNGSFSGCTALKAIEIPNSVLTIGGNAFQECSNLVSAKIGDGVQEVGYYVFYGCTRLEKVVMGAGVNIMGMRTFGGCNKLKSVTIMNPSVPTIDTANESFSSYNATVYVPFQSLDAYKASDIGQRFSNIKAIEDQVYLTIRQATEGAVKMLTNVGERYSYDIIPASGWAVHSVTFNNEDVTGQLVGNNYTTPAMTSNGTLSIVFVEEGSGVRSAAARDVRVMTDDSGNIIINEAPYGETISVYSTNGILLRQVPADGGRTSINMNAHGIYIVKVGDMTAKLSL